jgi:hypothetical protein
MYQKGKRAKGQKRKKEEKEGVALLSASQPLSLP